jgi:hypothetical protein
VESQAIKRAHRIGQTKPVFVETQGTLEEGNVEHRAAACRKGYAGWQYYELDHSERAFHSHPSILLKTFGTRGLKSIMKKESSGTPRLGDRVRC